MKIPLFNIEIKRASKVQASPRIEIFRGRGISAEQIHKQISRSYAGAKSDRLTADWGSAQSSANAEIYQSAQILRGRNRQLERDNDYFRRCLRLVENNVVGSKGIRLQNKARDFIGKDEKGNAKFRMDAQANSMIEAAWTKWNRPENCTVMRNMSGVDLQRLIVRRFGPDGGLLVRIHRGFANAFQYAVEPLEIDRLDFNYNTFSPLTGNQVVFGLELDQFNAVVAYWLLTKHPGDFLINTRGNAKIYRERVDAKDVLFVHGGMERAEQVMPMPIWTSIANRLWQLERYEEAVQIASRTAACGGVFIKQDKPTDYTGPVAADGTQVQDLEPGTRELLDPGQEPVQFDPKFPMTESTGYIKSQIRGVASGSNLSTHAVGNDLSDVNYSSIRAGNLEDQEEYKGIQNRLVEYLMTPLFEDWLPFAILSGQLALPLAKLEKFSAPSWRPRRWSYVNPKDEVEANIKSIAARLESREDVIEETGRDMEDVDAQFAADEHLKDLPVENAYLNNYVAPQEVSPPAN